MKNPQRLCAVFAAIFVLSLGLVSCPDPTKDPDPVNVEDGVSVNYDTLADDLEAISGDSVAAPVTVKLTETLISTANPAPVGSIGWGDIYAIFSAAKKYVILDLSQCSFTDNTVTGRYIYSENPAGNDMNIMYNNEHIKGVILPSGLASMGECAFMGCTGLTSIAIPGSIISIELDAFADCTGLTSITIPEGVTSIGDEAFVDCTGLINITIPRSVTSIGEIAFAGCTALTSITVDPTNTVYTSENGVLYNKMKTSIVSYPAGKSGSSIIPGSVTSIELGAFYGCTSLTNITIPEGVTSIGEHAFRNCSGLTSITIPEGISSIGQYVFRGCTALTSITIPENVTSIEYGAFSGCTGLINITIPGSVTSIEYSAFIDCTGLTSITIQGNTSIKGGAFYDCTGLTKVTFEGTGAVIDPSAFSYSTSVGSDTLKTLYEANGAGTYTRTEGQDDWKYLP